MKKISKSFVEKTFSLFLICSFLVYQTPIAFAQGVDQNALPQEESLNTPTTAASGEDAVLAQPEPETPSDFLAQGPLQEPSIKTTIQEEEKARREAPRELERYGFGRAIDSLQDNLATAVILKSLNEKHIKRLLDLKMEIGIAVLHGEIILFTSGSSDDIHVQKPVLDLLKDANFISHTHPEASTSDRGPSSQDIALAVAYPDVEYLLTTHGVYSYNNSGLLNGGVPTDFKDYIETLADARRDGRTAEPRNSVAARQTLNEFIYQMDLLNDPATRDDELFRASGSVNPDPLKTTPDITNIPGNPFTTVVFSAPASVSMNPSNAKTTTMTYDTSTPGWAGGGFSYDDFGTGPIETGNWNALTNIVVGLGGTATKVKFEVVDDADKKAHVFLNGVTSTRQIWNISMTQLLTGADAGFDISKVRLIYFVVDANDGADAAGHLDIQMEPSLLQIGPSGGLTSSNLSELPGDPQIAAVSASPATANMAAINNTSATLSYNTSTVGWAGGGYSFDNFATGPVETRDLSSFTQLVFGLQGDSSQVKFEIIDITGAKNEVQLTGISSSTEQFWSIPTSVLTNVDLTQIKLFYFIVEGAGKTGNLEIEIDKVPPVLQLVAPTAGLTLSKVTTLPILPTPAAVNFLEEPPSLNAFLSQPKPEEIQISYPSLGNNQYVGSSINFGPAGRSLSGISNFIFGASGPVGGKVKLEFKDASGRQATVLLTGLGAAATFYQVSAVFLKSITPLLDLAHITEINFIVDNTYVPAGAGAFSIFLKGQAFNASYNPQSSLTAANVSTLPVNSAKKQPRAQVVFGADPFPKNEFSQTSTQQAAVDYDISTGQTFSGVTVSFDNFLTTSIETAAWPSSLTNLVVGLKGPAGATSRIKVEFVNSSGVSKSMYLNNVTGTEQFYQIPLTLFNGFLKKSIRYINFVIDTDHTTDLTDTLEVRMNGLFFYEQSLKSDPTLTASKVTILPALPSTTVLGGSQGNSSYLQLGTTGLELLYDTSVPNSFSGTTISFDNYLTPAVETWNLGGVSEFVFGASSATGGGVVVQFKDSQGRIENRVLTGLTATEKYYRITKTTFDIIDWTKIREINLIAEDSKLPNDRGLIKVSIKGLKDPKALTTAQTTLRQQIIADNVKYFVDGLGVDAVTQLPYDNIFYSGNTPTPNKFTQPTAIAFYAQILGDVIRGRTIIPGVTKLQAMSKLQTLVNSLKTAQETNPAVTRKGLFMTFMDLSTGALTAADPPHFFALGDNSNLAQGLAVVVGALEGGVFSSTEAILKNDIIKAITGTVATTGSDGILAHMAEGFREFYECDPSITDAFCHTYYADAPYNNFQGPYPSINTLDRMSNEFRDTVGFLVTYYGNFTGFTDASNVPLSTIDTSAAWDNLNSNLVAYNTNLMVPPQNYTDSQNAEIPNVVPYDGAAFQMFWPLLRTNEENYVEMQAMLKNFLYSVADYAARNGLPGFPSAGLVPGRDYDVNLGIPDLSEDFLQSGAQAVSNVGNIYALASAYALDPNFVLTWLAAIKERNPQVLSPNLGFYDSAISPTEVGKKHFAIDQASLVLALTNAGGDDFDVFMKNRGLDDDFRGLYREVDMQLPQVNKVPAAPPVFPSETLTVFNHIGSISNVAQEGNVNIPTNAVPAFPLPVPLGTQANGILFQYTNHTTDGGHYWSLDQDHDARGSRIRIDYTVETDPGIFDLVLCNDDSSICNNFTLNGADTAAGNHTKYFDVPALAAYQNIGQVKIIVRPTQAPNIQTAEFFVHQIQFQRFNTADPSLTAAHVTVLPPLPSVDPFLGNVGAVPVLKYYNTNTIDISYDVSAQADSFAGATVHYDDFLTGAKEFANLSAGDSLVVGLSGPGGTSLKVEFVDADGHVGTITLEGLGAVVKFFKLRKSDLILVVPGQTVDFTRISQINFVTDQGLAGGNNTGTIRVVTEGLKPSVNVLPDIALVIGNVTILPPKPIVGGVSGGGGQLSNNVTALNVSGTDTVAFDYDISAGGFAGALLQYDNPATTPKVEFKDLSKIPNLVFGLTAPAGAGEIKLEFKDSTNAIKTLYLQYTGPGEVFYKIPASYLTGINRAAITQINFIVDDVVTLIDTGTVTIRTDGL